MCRVNNSFAIYKRYRLTHIHTEVLMDLMDAHVLYVLYKDGSVN